MTQVLTVEKAVQTITFVAPQEVTRQTGSVPLNVSASSGLPITLTVDDAQVATIQETTLQILRLGTVRITASQSGNENYHPAEPVTVSVRVVDPSSDIPIRVHPALSPNGDGINEFLMIEAIRDYPDNRVTIFNRNGTILWEASGYDNRQVVFRGVGKGNVRLSTGTYYYIIDVNDNGVPRQIKGYFVIAY